MRLLHVVLRARAALRQSGEMLHEGNAANVGGNDRYLPHTDTMPS